MCQRSRSGGDYEIRIDGNFAVRGSSEPIFKPSPSVSPVGPPAETRRRQRDAQPARWPLKKGSIGCRFEPGAHFPNASRPSPFPAPPAESRCVARRVKSPRVPPAVFSWAEETRWR